MRWPDDGYLAWSAPGNMLAQRGTLSFFWRAREPVGEAPFVLFRTGFADHSSWDMAFLRIDYNGHGFDAFVTDLETVVDTAGIARFALLGISRATLYEKLGSS